MLEREGFVLVSGIDQSLHYFLRLFYEAFVTVVHTTSRWWFSFLSIKDTVKKFHDSTLDI
jgi:hypothetical protein